MKNKKLSNRMLVFLFGCVLLFSACGNNAEQDEQKQRDAAVKKQKMDAYCEHKQDSLWKADYKPIYDNIDVAGQERLIAAIKKEAQLNQVMESKLVEQGAPVVKAADSIIGEYLGYWDQDRSYGGTFRSLDRDDGLFMEVIYDGAGGVQSSSWENYVHDYVTDTTKYTPENQIVIRHFTDSVIGDAKGKLRANRDNTEKEYEPYMVKPLVDTSEYDGTVIGYKDELEHISQIVNERTITLTCTNLTPDYLYSPQGKVKIVIDSIGPGQFKVSNGMGKSVDVTDNNAHFTPSVRYVYDVEDYYCYPCDSLNLEPQNIKVGDTRYDHDYVPGTMTLYYTVVDGVAVRDQAWNPETVMDTATINEATRKIAEQKAQAAKKAEDVEESWKRAEEMTRKHFGTTYNYTK